LRQNLLARNTANIRQTAKILAPKRFGTFATGFVRYTNFAMIEA